MDHSSRKHALLSASGAHRWLNCTPSAVLEDKFDSSKTQSVYAQEGTLAHELADITLRLISTKYDMSSSVFQKELARLKKDALYSEEMEVQVKKYVDIVYEEWKASKGELIVEERIDYSHVVKNGFGTNDAAVISDGKLQIFDLKYGKGVKVDADNNPQLMLYAVGMLHKYEMIYDIETVKMCIVQPRLDHYSAFELPVWKLLDWVDEVVIPKAKQAYYGKGEKVAGDWCRFCKVRAACSTLANKNLELAKHEFKDPDLLDMDRLVEIYKQLPMLLSWANAVSDYLLNEALKGKKVKGHKVVEGKSNRRWSDEKKVISLLLESGHKKENVVVEKLRSLTSIERLVGKKVFTTKLKNLVVKPQGKPTLVDENDKRPALGIEQAKLDFKS